MNDKNEHRAFFWAFVSYLIGMGILAASGGAWFLYLLFGVIDNG